MDAEKWNELYGQGLGDGEIARAARTHHAVIRHWRNKEGLKANPPREMPPKIQDVSFWTPEREKRAAELWQSGMSGSEIAADIGGTSRNAVIGKIHRLGLAKRVSVSPVTTSTKESRQAKAKISVPRLPPPPKVSPVRAALRNLANSPLNVTDLSPTLSWAELEDSVIVTQCRAMPGDHLSGGKVFCGRPIMPGTSYCECHARQYLTPIEVARAKASDRPSWHSSAQRGSEAVFGSGREKTKAY